MTARRVAAGLVAVWLSNGAIHYDLSHLPPDAEARIACCANGPAEDGACAKARNVSNGA